VFHLLSGQTDITNHFSSSAPPIFGFPGWENSLLFFTSLFRFVSFFLGKGNSTERVCVCVYVSGKSKIHTEFVLFHFIYLHL